MGSGTLETRSLVPPPALTNPSTLPSCSKLPHGGRGRVRHAAQISARANGLARRHRYGKRSLVQTAISCIKCINGGRLSSRTFRAQRNEVAIHIKIANRTMTLARPVSVPRPVMMPLKPGFRPSESVHQSHGLPLGEGVRSMKTLLT